MSNLVSPSEVNDLFLAGIATDGDMQKTAAATSVFIKDRVREMSFTDIIIPPKFITKDELDQSDRHEQPVKLGYIQPNAEAAIINFRSEPDEQWIEGKKFLIPFFKIASPRMKKTEAELMTYRYPITKEIEEVMIKDMARVKDMRFMETAAAIVVYQTATLGEASADQTVAGFSRATIAAGANRLESEVNVPVGCILINKATWNLWNATAQTDVGDSVASEMTRTGYASDKIAGYKILVTNKAELVTNKEAWFFSEPEYLGASYILSDVRFEISKKEDLITMVAWGYFGMGIGNLRSICKIHWV